MPYLSIIHATKVIMRQDIYIVCHEYFVLYLKVILSHPFRPQPTLGTETQSPSEINLPWNLHKIQYINTFKHIGMEWSIHFNLLVCCYNWTCGATWKGVPCNWHLSQMMIYHRRTLNHCGLVTPYGNMDLGQHWLRLWLVAWWHQAITLTMLTYHQ